MLQMMSALAFQNGNALLAVGHSEEAIIEYDKAIALKPDAAEAYSNKGLDLHSLSRYEEAVVEYNKAISMRPNDAPMYYNKGDRLRELGRYEEATLEHNIVISLNPSYISDKQLGNSDMSQLPEINDIEFLSNLFGETHLQEEA